MKLTTVRNLIKRVEFKYVGWDIKIQVHPSPWINMSRVTQIKSVWQLPSVCDAKAIEFLLSKVICSKTGNYKTGDDNENIFHAILIPDKINEDNFWPWFDLLARAVFLHEFHHSYHVDGKVKFYPHSVESGDDAATPYDFSQPVYMTVEALAADIL